VFKLLLPKYISHRRNELKRVEKKGSDDLSESCVLSYTHPNMLAALVAWNRLYIARRLYKKYSTGNEVLDFGAGSGELGRLLSSESSYTYIEEIVELANLIETEIKSANRSDLSNLKKLKYDAIFCLDSLEHNTNYMDLTERLLSSLKPGGVLIVSGPTENVLYRLGRKVAGFTGDYHVTNIFAIEEFLKTKMTLVHKRFTPFGFPLFSLSVWRLPSSSRRA
jgi:2-polyprenyl-3-methyl-5-hydroxy-6-metoxy-1,4-benzoquinol methylase